MTRRRAQRNAKGAQFRERGKEANDAASTPKPLGERESDSAPEHPRARSEAPSEGQAKSPLPLAQKKLFTDVPEAPSQRTKMKPSLDSILKGKNIHGDWDETHPPIIDACDIVQRRNALSECACVCVGCDSLWPAKTAKGQHVACAGGTRCRRKILGTWRLLAESVITA